MSGVDGLREPGGLREQIAATIRREVRLSAGIPEGQEFRCDWEAVADAVVAALGLEEEWNVLTDMGVKSHSPLTEERARHLAERFNDMTARRRWVSGWSVVAGDK